ncbi:MAG: Crp/Fnr family transcriptional regulator [Clostridia bacterium]|nr:Crp/Fnr family transcriptional regulator [Clostridia bacterium]
MAELREYLPKLPFWDSLGEEEKVFVRRNAGIRRAAAGQLIYSSDCACVGLVYVISGKLRIYSLSSEGREITLFTICGGDSSVLSASCVVEKISFDAHMVAETDSELLIVNAEAMAALTQGNIHARCFLFERAAEDFASVMRTMESILFSGFDSRLASFLTAECERTGSRVLPLTRSRIAEQVNSAREVVTRMLKRFSAEGLVETGRGTVTVLDLEGLKKYIR